MTLKRIRISFEMFDKKRNKLKKSRKRVENFEDFFRKTVPIWTI